MRSPGWIAGLCGLLVGPGCLHEPGQSRNPGMPSGWYPGSTIVGAVRLGKDLHAVATKNAEERAAAEKAAAAEAEREKQREAARQRVLEQELTANEPPPPPNLTAQRTLVRAQPGAARPAQAFARGVIALARRGEHPAEELAALAGEAAGYLQASLATSALRKVDIVAWRGEARTSFCLLGELPRTPEVDDALVRGCKPARLAMTEEQVPGFAAECRERAGGDAGRLAWSGVEQDLTRAAATSDRSHCG